MREERFIIKVLEMHYKQGMSQQEIGKKLNVSRTTVSRALAQAKREGYVQITINYPEGDMTTTEAALEEKFNLKEVVIASSQEESEIRDETAFFASDYVLRVLKNHMTIAITRGTSLQKMSEYMKNDVRLKFLKTDDVKVVPLMAATNAAIDDSVENRLAYSNFLVDEVAKILNGRSYQLLAPQYVTSLEAKKVFLNEGSVSSVFDLAGSADIAVMGIGNLTEESSLLKAHMVPPEEFERLRAKGGVGELLCHIIDSEGKLVQDEFEDHLLSVSLDDLKKIPIRVGVACGLDKKEAILAVLKGGYINVLITDDKVARYLSEVSESETL